MTTHTHSTTNTQPCHHSHEPPRGPFGMMAGRHTHGLDDAGMHRLLAAEVASLRAGVSHISLPQALAALPPVWADVLLERIRQVDVEGFTPSADDHYAGTGQLAAAASCYLTGNPSRWPWHVEWWKPKADEDANIRRGVALGLAELERRARLAARLARPAANDSEAGHG